jgi:hypothetical protein
MYDATPSTNESTGGMLNELFCLGILVGIVWMFIPGTVTMTDGELMVHPDWIPLIIFITGFAGVIISNVMRWKDGEN